MRDWQMAETSKRFWNSGGNSDDRPDEVDSLCLLHQSTSTTTCAAACHLLLTRLFVMGHDAA